jgi:hypothetical protein
MSLRKRILDLEKKVEMDDTETDYLINFVENPMAAIAHCMQHYENHGCFPPDLPGQIREILSTGLEDDWDDLSGMPDIRT